MGDDSSTDGSTGTNGSAAAEAPPTQVVGGGKNVVMPTSALGRLKQEARERGKKEAMAELEKQAKAVGFESLQSMFATTAALVKGGQNHVSAKTNGAQKQPQRQQPPTQHHQEASEEQQPVQQQRPNTNGNGQSNGNRSWKEQRRHEQLLERERKARDEERRFRLQEEKRRKRAEQHTEALEAEMYLREQAIMSGVKDVDYAVTLLRRSIEGKTERELQSYDEQKFFSELREKQPYLFGEISRPVTTGTGAGNAPTAPTPGKVTQQAANSAQVDAAKMNDKEYKEHLRKRGLNLDPNSFPA
jgi:hypothetical protein